MFVGMEKTAYMLSLMTCEKMADRHDPHSGTPYFLMTIADVFYWMASSQVSFSLAARSWALFYGILYYY